MNFRPTTGICLTCATLWLFSLRRNPLPVIMPTNYLHTSYSPRAGVSPLVLFRRESASGQHVTDTARISARRLVAKVRDSRHIGHTMPIEYPVILLRGNFRWNRTWHELGTMEWFFSWTYWKPQTQVSMFTTIWTDLSNWSGGGASTSRTHAVFVQFLYRCHSLRAQCGKKQNEASP